MNPNDYTYSPPEWLYNGFPLHNEDDDSIDLNLALIVCRELLAATTDSDFTPLGRALHIAHSLVTLQSEQGDWPIRWHGKTGEPIGPETSCEPLALFRQLKDRLKTTEFDRVIARAEAGISSK